MRSLRFLLALSFFVALSAQATVNLKDVDFNSLPGGKVEMRFKFDGQVPEPNVYTIEKPARIAIDLNQVSSQLAQKKHTLDLGNAQSVVVVESSGRTRLIINLLELTKYETSIKDDELVVVVGNDGVKDYLKSSTAELATKKSAATVSTISSIDFRRGEKGEGRLLIELSNPNVDVDTRVEGRFIKLSFMDTEIPQKLQLKYDVSDFATPVQSVKAAQKDNIANLEILPTGEYDYLAYQTENTYVLTVKPLTREEVEAKKKAFAYVGDKLSLNFQDIDVRAVLQLIADFTDLNLVASDTVGGKITLRLQNVPWDQALDIILKTKGLDKRLDGNILLVAPAAEIAQREQQEIQTNKQLEELAPLQTEFIRVRYAKAADIFSLLQGKKSSSGDEPSAEASGSLLSSRATVIVDERTNSLLVTETAAKLEELRNLISLIDVPVRQVLIEARIVSANSDASEKLGIEWGGTYNGTNSSNDKQVVLSGDQNTLYTYGTDGSPIVQGNLASIVDLGVTDPGATRFNIGFISGGHNRLLDLELSAIESSGNGEVVSQPKIITGDKQNAVIKSGQEVAYQESSANGGTTTSFKDAALVLDVTPSITPDDRILMEIDLQQDSISGYAPNDTPIIDTTQLQTQVLINNGETVVLGGIFQTESVKSETKTPFLGDIPYLGRLFRRTIQSDVKTEVLIFITPRILADSLVE